MRLVAFDSKIDTIHNARKGKLNMSVKSSFAEMLYNGRVAKHWTQRQAAENGGVSLRHYQDLELGITDPKLSTAVRLASVLEIELDSLKSEVCPIALSVSGL